MALGIPWAMAHGYSVGTKNHSDLGGNGCLGGSDPYPHADPSVPTLTPLSPGHRSAGG